MELIYYTRMVGLNLIVEGWAFPGCVSIDLVYLNYLEAIYASSKKWTFIAVSRCRLVCESAKHT